jgi:hypothetical protein
MPGTACPIFISGIGDPNAAAAALTTNAGASFAPPPQQELPKRSKLPQQPKSTKSITAYLQLDRRAARWPELCSWKMP